MSIATSLMTARELLRLPQEFPTELVRGELIRMSPSGARHGQLASRLCARLQAHVEAHGGGVVMAAETGFILERNPDTVRAPDVAFIAQDRLPATGVPEGFWPFAPDLAVEVVSPNDSPTAVAEKVAQYLLAGTREVWVVDPAPRRLTLHRPDAAPQVLEAGAVLESSDVLAGLRLELRSLFAP